MGASSAARDWGWQSKSMTAGALRASSCSFQARRICSSWSRSSTVGVPSEFYGLAGPQVVGREREAYAVVIVVPQQALGYRGFRAIGMLDSGRAPSQPPCALVPDVHRVPARVPRHSLAPVKRVAERTALAQIADDSSLARTQRRGNLEGELSQTARVMNALDDDSPIIVLGRRDGDLRVGVLEPDLPGDPAQWPFAQVDQVVLVDHGRPALPVDIDAQSHLKLDDVARQGGELPRLGVGQPQLAAQLHKLLAHLPGDGAVLAAGVVADRARQGRRASACPLIGSTGRPPCGRGGVRLAKTGLDHAEKLADVLPRQTGLGSRGW